MTGKNPRAGAHSGMSEKAPTPADIARFVDHDLTQQCAQSFYRLWLGGKYLLKHAPDMPVEHHPHQLAAGRYRAK
jgi:hypothetical protein